MVALISSSMLFSNHGNPNSANRFKLRASKTTRLTVPQVQNPSKHSKKHPKNPAVKPQFAEEDAFPSSLPLHTKNPHAIYDDIQKFAKKGKIKESLVILDYLDQQGIPVNATTFSSLIYACIRTKSLSYGKQIHAYIRINGLEDNDFLRTKLVNMYTSCGSTEDAQKVFDTVPTKNIFTWNALLRGNVVSGGRQYQEVLSTFSEMRGLGIELNVYTFSCLIKSLAGANAFTQGLKTHSLLIKNGLSNSEIVRTSLIDMYCKCGKIKLAHQLFEEIPEKDIVAWGTMISGFAHNSLQREALEYTRRMIIEGIGTNSVILTIILPVIGELGVLRLGKEIHAHVMKNTLYSNQLFIQSGLIDMYCKCGDLGSGRRFFYGSKDRSVVSWTALISGYVSNGKLDQALRSIAWMQQEGFKPDAVTIATVLPVCAELRALKQGKELHCYALKNNFLPNISITTSLMMMYSKCKLFEYSSNLFDGLDRRNVIAWTCMIEACMDNDRLHDALAVFRSMQMSKHRPDSVTTSRIFRVCGILKALKLGKEIHGHAVRKDFEKIPSVSKEIIKMYGNSGLIDKSRLVFDAIVIKGPMTWTAIIEAYGCNERYRDAVDLFDRMVRDGFTPNHFTFDVVLSICVRGGFVNEARRIFDLMIKKYKIKANEEHYSMVIELLTSFGYVDEANKFIQKRSLL